MKRRIGTIVTALFCLCAIPMSISAASSEVSGTLKLRMLDGSSNGKYYTIGANKEVSISGTVMLLK